MLSVMFVVVKSGPRVGDWPANQNLLLTASSQSLLYEPLATAHRVPSAQQT